MRASVVVRTPDGVLHELGHGDILGRLQTASLHIDDARVSEAHSMVSLRGGELKLLSLRSLFAVDGKPLRELVLRVGQRIEIVRGLALSVEEVRLPDAVVALAMPGLVRQPLPGACWLLTRPHPRLVPKPSKAAVAEFWFTGDAWKVRVGGGPAQEFAPGWTATVDGVEVSAVSHALSRAGQQPTRLAGGVSAPLRLVCHFDTVVIEREGVMELTLTGQGARLISELVEIGAPVEWATLARQLWPGEDDLTLLRRRFDTVLARLRRKLKASNLRPDLVRADGGGRVMVHLEQGDEAISQ